MLQILRHTAFYVVLFLLLSSCAAIKGVKEVSCHLVDTISQQDLHLVTTYNVEVGNSDTICCSDRCFEEIMQLGVNGTNIYFRTVTDKEIALYPNISMIMTENYCLVYFILCLMNLIGFGLAGNTNLIRKEI